MNAITNNTEFAAVSFAATANVDETVRPFINEFSHFANKSAENVLEMCKVVASAKSALPDTLFNQFCLAIGLKKDASAISKMAKIGKRYTILSQYKNHLPSAWTTLYRLSDMGDEAFKAAIEARQIHCNMTAKDLNAIAPSKVNSKRRSGCITINQSHSNEVAPCQSFTLKSAIVLNGEQIAAVKAKLSAIGQEYSLNLIAA